MRIDPWSSRPSTDYERLLSEFGIEPFRWVGRLEEIARERGLPPPPPIFRRGVVFGSRGFDRIVRALEKGEPFAVLTGLMPSGPMHLGHKLVLDQVVYYQSLGAEVFIAVADLEAYETRGISLEEAREIAATEYLPNYAALGLKPEKTQIYFQSRRTIVKDLGWKLARYVTWSTFEAIYGFSGDTKVGHVLSPLVQAGDILHVQLPLFGGPRPVVVPVGVDQDPHIRLARDLAQSTRYFSLTPTRTGGVPSLVISLKNNQDPREMERLGRELHLRRGIRSKPGGEVEAIFRALWEEALRPLGALDVEIHPSYGTLTWQGATESEALDADLRIARFEVEALGGMGFVTPSSTYHRFALGLTGEKMSSSRPETHIALNESADSAVSKLKGAKTGGRATAKEQRMLGADPTSCIVFENYLEHLIPDDREIGEIEALCRGGRILCGECKSKFGEEPLRRLWRRLEEGRQRSGETLAKIVRED